MSSAGHRFAPLLPPTGRGKLAARWASTAARGAFELPTCDDCGRIQYPLRELCRHCLSANVRFKTAPRGGKLLATTRLHRSNHPYFFSRLPIRLGSIELDAGATVIAFLSEDCTQVGARVTLRCGIDLSGQPILSALPETSLETDAMTLSDTSREIEGKVVLVTGSTGGIGSALIHAFLNAGASRVIAVARKPIAWPDARVLSLELDVTDRAGVNAAANVHAKSIDILVNSSGVNTGGRILEQRPEDAVREMEVNYLGVLHMAQAFLPAMIERRAGVLMNVLTVLAHVNLPLMATYCASKAAAFSITQALRAETQRTGVRVCGVFPGVVDTEMSAHIAGPKLAPAELASAVIAALRNGTEDLYPASAEAVRALLQQDWKAVERSMAARLAGAL